MTNLKANQLHGLTRDEFITKKQEMDLQKAKQKEMLLLNNLLWGEDLKKHQRLEKEHKMKTLMRKQKRSQKLEQKMKCKQDDDKRISDI